MQTTLSIGELESARTKQIHIKTTASGYKSRGVGNSRTNEKTFAAAQEKIEDIHKQMNHQMSNNFDTHEDTST